MAGGQNEGTGEKANAFFGEMCQSLFMVYTFARLRGRMILSKGCDSAMDMVKMGRFLAELRKEHDLTQAALGEKLGVTNKTVSRWETGSYMPPVEILIALSELYGLTINEILSGRRLAVNEYREMAESNIRETLRASTFCLQERQDFWKKKWRREHISAVVACVAAWITAMLLLNAVGVEQYLIGAFGGIFSVLLYMGLNNRMMAYVEDHIYGGRGNKCECASEAKRGDQR